MFYLKNLIYFIFIILTKPVFLCYNLLSLYVKGFYLDYYKKKGQQLVFAMNFTAVKSISIWKYMQLFIISGFLVNILNPLFIIISLFFLIYNYFWYIIIGKFEWVIHKFYLDRLIFIIILGVIYSILGDFCYIVLYLYLNLPIFIAIYNYFFMELDIQISRLGFLRFFFLDSSTRWSDMHSPIFKIYLSERKKLEWIEKYISEWG